VLLLRLRRGESIFVGDVEFRLIGMRGKRADVGIEAPRQIAISKPQFVPYVDPKRKENQGTATDALETAAQTVGAL
jgi:sRNA-binding carbon storage regulator CsrA